ncbi:MAG: endonuclease [Marmoricola sp.]|nr:endonuclease [Marmoricola sp.]
MDGFSTAVMTDHELLYGGVVDLVSENRAGARRWARVVELYRRRPEVDPGVSGNFPMRAREWVAVETSEAWAIGDHHARSQLNIALFLEEHLPDVWDLCLAGALDRYRATIVADLLRQRLDDPADWAVAAQRITAFLVKHLRAYPEFNVELVTCTARQLRNRLNYVIRQLASPEEEFQRSLAERGVSVFHPEDGIAHLTITGTTDQVLLARHRLHLSAKVLRAEGDARTVEQLMADLALDLIIGRADGIPIPGYARPIINVTVPLETLAGLSDEPGLLSGGAVIPADLARAIATSDGATWYRLLTDPVGDPVALSTKSYQPTGAIWRYVVATNPTCAHQACDRPSVQCELDHDEPYPQGPTDTENLKPRCRRHHKAKHARAERADLDWEHAWAS